MSTARDKQEGSCQRRWPTASAWGGHMWKVFLLLSVVANVYMSGVYIKYSIAVPATQIRGTLELAAEESSFADNAPERGLGSASSASSNTTAAHGSSHGSCAGSSCANHGGHQHDALLFLFNAILVGTTVLYLTSLYPAMQLSIVLFVIGMVMSLVLEGLSVKKKIGLWGQSYMMWMDIDPHLLLFTMLPTLLAGDAMTIDTSVAQRVGKQCLYLAGPGVLISSFVVGVFLMFFLDWSFMLSLTTGSILCATDPVAVVALLKELGASPTLTVQIQGESLLNDGTAIVLYTIAYDMLSGQEYDIADMMMFMVRVAIMAVGVGIFLGYFFYTWMRFASDRFNHSATVIQILLTMCAAYWSFVLAEGVLKMSGVLSTVTCSLVLAHHMWPYVVDKEAMLDFWHVMENLGNIIIFILGGALVGAAMVHIDPVDYINLIVIYLFLLLLRGGFIFASRPILQRLHRDKVAVTWEEATIMTWGGLRGAVGLALAMQVNRGKAANKAGVEQISQNDADRVLFFVAGVAFLTTCVNAQTCPMLVTWLGITSMPEAESKLLQKFNNQLLRFSKDQYHPPQVTHHLEKMLGEISDEINRKKPKTPPKGVVARAEKMMSAEAIVEDYRKIVEKFKAYSDEDRARTSYLPADHEGQEEKWIELVLSIPPDTDVLRIVNKTLLSMVNAYYWYEIEHGELRPGSSEAEALFTSVRFSSMKLDLMDIKVLHKFCRGDDLNKKGGLTIDAETMTRRPTDSVSGSNQFGAQGSQAVAVEDEGPLTRFVHSAPFNIGIAVCIILNVSYVGVEEVTKNKDNENSNVWIILESTFCVIFVAEFLIKFAQARMAYFHVTWNNFDFFLVVLGIGGLVMSFIALNEQQTAGGGTSESRVIRVARVCRTMRFLRLFRLFHARLSADKHVDETILEQMKAMQARKSFVEAHVVAQKNLMKYFGQTLKNANEVELARCLLQSVSAVHEVVIEEIRANRENAKLVAAIDEATERKHLVESLENFIETALEVGAISNKNAGALLHPLHHEVSDCIAYINKRCEGLDDGERLHALGDHHGHHHIDHHLDGHGFELDLAKNDDEKAFRAGSLPLAQQPGRLQEGDVVKVKKKGALLGKFGVVVSACEGELYTKVNLGGGDGVHNFSLLDLVRVEKGELQEDAAASPESIAVAPPPMDQQLVDSADAAAGGGPSAGSASVAAVTTAADSPVRDTAKARVKKKPKLKAKKKVTKPGAGDEEEDLLEDAYDDDTEEQATVSSADGAPASTRTPSADNKLKAATTAKRTLGAKRKPVAGKASAMAPREEEDISAVDKKASLLPPAGSKMAGGKAKVGGKEEEAVAVRTAGSINSVGWSEAASKAEPKIKK